MIETEAGLDQSPQGEPVRWCPHRPLPPHGDVTTRRVASFLFASRVTGQHHLGVPRNYSPTASFRVQGSAEPAAATCPTRAKWEAKTRRGAGSRTPQEENARAAESLVSAFRRTFLERNFPHSGADGDARRGHVIRRIIGQNFVAARIYVVRVCVYVCVLVREREIFAPFLPFFQRLSSA